MMENAGVEMNNVARIRNGQNIRRPGNMSNLIHDLLFLPISTIESRVS